jgi:hypothetical protein
MHRPRTETAPSGAMRRQKDEIGPVQGGMAVDNKTKRDGNRSPHKNKLIQDSEGNEENGCPVPDSNKTKINYAKEPNKAHKNTLKEKILQVITENFMEM